MLMLHFFQRGNIVKTNKSKSFIKNGMNIHIIQAAFFIALGLAILSSITFAMIAKSDKIKHETSELKQLSEKWTNEDTGEVFSFPYQLDLNAHNPITISTTLPSDINNKAIYYDCSYCTQEVYVDDELVFSFATKSPLPFGNMRGSARALIPLKSDYAGKKLTIKMFSTYGGTDSSLPGIYYGLPGEFKFKQLHEGLWRVVIFIILIVLSLISNVFGVYKVFTNDPKLNFVLIYFSLLSFCVGTWIIVDPCIMQFFTSNLVVTQYISFVVLLFIGAFYSGMCSCLFTNQKGFFQVSEVLGYTLFVIMLILYIINIADPTRFMYVTYLYAFYCLVSTMIVTFKFRKDYPDIHSMVVANIVLLLGVGVSIVMFLANPLSSQSVYSFTVAFSIFIVFLFVILLKKELVAIKEAAKVYTYKKLAYIDALTNIPNRAAYERDIESIENDKSHKQELTLIIGDLNHLKQVNDNEGHDAGDLLIKNAAQAIANTFEGIGTYYRIGGDEFAILISNSTKPIDQHLTELKNNTTILSEKENTNISFALGYATVSLPSDDDSFKSTLFRTADKNMYQNKMLMHKKGEQ